MFSMMSAGVNCWSKEGWNGVVFSMALISTELPQVIWRWWFSDRMTSGPHGICTTSSTQVPHIKSHGAKESTGSRQIHVYLDDRGVAFLHTNDIVYTILVTVYVVDVCCQCQKTCAPCNKKWWNVAVRCCSNTFAEMWSLSWRHCMLYSWLCTIMVIHMVCTLGVHIHTPKCAHHSMCTQEIQLPYHMVGCVVERRSLSSALCLSCAWPVADEWPFMWVNRPL